MIQRYKLLYFIGGILSAISSILNYEIYQLIALILGLSIIITGMYCNILMMGLENLIEKVNHED